MFFFKKQPTQEPKKPEYPAELDAARDSILTFIDLTVFGDKVVSIERDNLNTPDEKTVVYTLAEKAGEVDEYCFRISRKQHKELIEQFKNK